MRCLRSHVTRTCTDASGSMAMPTLHPSRAAHVARGSRRTTIPARPACVRRTVSRSATTRSQTPSSRTCANSRHEGTPVATRSCPVAAEAAVKRSGWSSAVRLRSLKRASPSPNSAERRIAPNRPGVVHRTVWSATVPGKPSNVAHTIAVTAWPARVVGERLRRKEVVTS